MAPEQAVCQVTRAGVSYSGSTESLARLFHKMELKRDDGDDEEEDPTPSPKKIKMVRQCRAIKVDGVRCRHTSLTSKICGDGLCFVHRHWIDLNRPVASL